VFQGVEVMVEDVGEGLGGFLEAVGIVGALFAGGVLDELLLPLKAEEGGGGDAVGIGEALKGAGGGVAVQQGLKEAVANELVDGGGDIGVIGDSELGQIEQVGLVANATGVVVEGGEANAVVGELELVEHGAVGGRIAVDEGLVEEAAGIGRELGEEGGVGFDFMAGMGV
jgi:hypothetical protein